MVVREQARETRIEYEVDVLVVGGGAAGIAAAVSAARAGASVLLVEKNGYLGGALTAVTLGSICGLYGVRGGNVQVLVRGIGEEIVDRLTAIGGAKDPKLWLNTASLPYDPELMKRVADQLVKAAGVTVLFHTLAVQVITEKFCVTGAIFENADGRWACLARTTIDCSGDGQVAAMAGADWQCVPEELQFPTTMMRFGGVESKIVDAMDRPTLNAHLMNAVDNGFDLPRTAGGIFTFNDSIAHLNITRVSHGNRAPNPLSAVEMTQAEIDGRAMAEIYLEAFRSYVPGYEKAYLLDTGAQIGVRESRRISGDYVVSIDDALSGARFDDAIACCAWPLEEHGSDRSTRWVWLPDGVYYQIPYRCLLPKGTDGLLVAGRCVSATHEAQASLRVAGTCFALGQAAGVAAFLAIDQFKNPRSVAIDALQGLLASQGVYLGLEPPLEITNSNLQNSENV